MMFSCLKIPMASLVNRCRLSLADLRLYWIERVGLKAVLTLCFSKIQSYPLCTYGKQVQPTSLQHPPFVIYVVRCFSTFFFIWKLDPSDSSQIAIDEVAPKIRRSIPDRGKLSFLQEDHLLSCKISSRILSFCLYFLPHCTVVVFLV